MSIQKSRLKILGQRERLISYLNGETIPPVTVEFNLTNRCAHDCWFCSDIVRREESNFTKLPWEVVKRTIEDFADMGVKSITFDGGGEPTLHPQFDEAFELAHHLGIKCGLTTMGELIKSDRKRDVVAYYADWVRISIDSASNETHQVMHRSKPGAYERVIENARELRKRNPKLVLGYSFIISDHNVHEVIPAIETAYREGFSYIDFKPLLLNGERFYLPEHLDIKGVIQSYDGRSSPYGEFRVYAVDLIGNSIAAPNFSICQSHNFVANVGANGNVYVCCAHGKLEGKPDRVFTKEEVTLGSLHNESFKAIWYGEKRKSITKFFLEKDNVKRCPTCRFGNHNEVLECLTNSPFNDHL